MPLLPRRIRRLELGAYGTSVLRPPLHKFLATRTVSNFKKKHDHHLREIRAFIEVFTRLLSPYACQYIFFISFISFSDIILVSQVQVEVE